MTRSKSRKFTLTGAASLLALSLATGAAYAQETEFDIEAQPLAKALLDFNEQSGLTVAAPRDLVADKLSPAVRGEMEPEEALEKILSESGLKSNELATGAYTITLASAEVTEQTPTSFRVAQLDPEEDVRGVDLSDEDEGEARQDVIVVTGTNIRGVSPDSSPSFTVRRDDIDKTGFGTVSELVQSFPQNFSGGSNAAIGSLPNDRAAGNNISSGSSVNLRGIGSGATLVLLNGSRLSPAGSIGDFVDISMIPLSAVERVEVLTDGASAIYGADAISGVVNFVLRDDYDGAETFLRYGSVTEGNLEEIRAGQTFGKSWGSGNALVSYEYFQRDNLGAEDRDFSSSVFLPNDLLPEQESHNVLISGSQQLTERINLRGHATFSQRDGLQETTLACCAGAFSFSRESRTEQYGGFIGVDIELWDDWLLDIGANYNKLEAFTEIAEVIPTQIDTDSDLWSLEGKVDGTVVEIPGGDVKLATGLSYREETFTNTNLISSTLVAEDDRSAFGAFAEVFLPIVGVGNRVGPGMERLELSIAARYDDYSDFGDTFNPKVGILWSPAAGLNLRGTYSTSFNPPNLGDSGNQTRRVSALFTPNPDSATGTSLAIVDSRANPNLTPETATTWTAGLDFKHEFPEGALDAALTWFDTAFEDRIDRAGRSDAFLLDPTSFAPVIIADPDPAFIAAVIADATSFRDRTSGLWTMPGDEEFYLDGRLLNLAQTDTSGIDLSLNYNTEQSFGDLDFGINSSYLFEQKKQITGSSPVFDVIDTVYNPVGFRFRANAGWASDGVSATAFVNYVDSYTDDRNILGNGDVSIPSWTTVDLNLSYDTAERIEGGVLDNTRFGLSVLNLFNEDPPAIEPDTFASGYDTTNASPLGRFIAFQVTKAW